MSAATVTRARGAAQSGRFAAIQRSRLLSAAIRALDELGYSDTSVADITTRARVSRRTFYEQFADREACLAAALEEALGALTRELDGTGVECPQWRERVRAGLWTILAFFDREPVLARVCVVQALRGGARVLERREQVLAQLAAVVDEARRESPRAARCTALTAEGLVGAAFGILYARLLKRSPRPLTGLLGELMAMIVLPYQGPAAARREQARPLPASRRPAAGAGAASQGELAAVAGVGGEASPNPERDGANGEGRGPHRHELFSPRIADPLESVPMRLTYRTARVLEGVEQLRGLGVSPSNREVAERAEIQDAGQVSKLLRRLEGVGLLANAGAGHAKGEPNAWRLTAKGKRVAASIRAHSHHESEAA